MTSPALSPTIKHPPNFHYDFTREYYDNFVQHREGPYAIQFPGGKCEWKTKHKKVSDPLLKAHLDGKYWVAVKAPWYPRWGYIDIDHPDPDTPYKITETLHLSESQHIILSSPRYKEKGNVHIIFRPRYNDKPMTQKLFRDILEPMVKSMEAELYPQQNRKFRLPFGRDQRPLDINGAPVPLTWQECIHFTDKIDEFEVSENVPHQLSLDFGPCLTGALCNKSDARALWKYGLPGPGTRHNSCLTLATYFYRLNHTPDETFHKLDTWLRIKHNGYSENINKGRWWFVNREVSDIVDWVYSSYRGGLIYPDSTHNIEGGYITPDDMKFMGEIFHGDLVNIRRLFKLILYYRPRSRWDWVYVPSRVWKTIADKSNYKEFQNTLKAKGLLKENSSYLVGSYSKQFKLTLPRTSQEFIANDGRAVHDFKQVALATFNDKKNVRDALGLNRKAIYRLFTAE